MTKEYKIKLFVLLSDSTDKGEEINATGSITRSYCFLNTHEAYFMQILMKNTWHSSWHKNDSQFYKLKWEKQVHKKITPFPKCWEDLGAGKSTHTQRLSPATSSCQWISVSRKHIIKWQTGWPKRKHNTIYTNSWSYIHSLSFFFPTCNGFLKTKSIHTHDLLRMNLKKHFFQESFLHFTYFL